MQSSRFLGRFNRFFRAPKKKLLIILSGVLLFVVLLGITISVSSEALYEMIYPVRVEQLPKDSYQAKEPIEITVKNAAQKQLSLTASYNGDDANTDVSERVVQRDKIFTLQPNTRVKPGTYTIRVTNLDSGEELSKQDFSWGVLAINTNKSIYTENEKVGIAMAVLDEAGNMVCDAEVELRISDPQGHVQTLSMANSRISVNPECSMHKVTEKPDYQANYQATVTGRYTITLRSVTNNGSHTIEDSFEVHKDVAFDVERVTATRIYPPEKYPVELKITANQAFKGKIVEPVPSDFQISQLGRDGVRGYTLMTDLPQTGTDPIPELRLPFNVDYEITSRFGDPIAGHDMEAIYKSNHMDAHDGIDFVIPTGSLVVAVDAGQVVLAKENWLYGNTVVIEHSWGRSYYGHLSRIDVAEGQQVNVSSNIGLSGSSGVNSPQLHFGIKPTTSDPDNLYYGKIDPAKYLGLQLNDPASQISLHPNQAKALVWDIELEAGQSITLGYQYKAPNTSPNFYTLGPLQFIQTSPADSQSNNDPLDAPGDSTSGQPAVIFHELRTWQIAVDATTTTTFTFSGTAEGWAYTQITACTNITAVYTGAAGNPSGSLETAYSKLSGANDGPCNFYWEWSGNWENLGVPVGDTVTGISGSYDYQVPTNTTSGTWSTGAFDLRDSAGTLRTDIVAALTGQTGTVPAFTNRSNTNQSFAGEASNTSIRLRLASGFTLAGGGSRAITFRNDNVSVTVTHAAGPTMDQVLRHGNWFSGGAEQTFTF